MWSQSWGQAMLKLCSVDQGLRLVVSEAKGRETPLLEALALQKPPESRALNQEQSGHKLSFFSPHEKLVFQIDQENGEFQLLHLGRPVLTKGRFSRSGLWTRLQAEFDSSIKWLGLGEKTGSLFKNPGFWRIWNIDECDLDPGKDPMYQAAPYIIGQSSRGQVFGLYFDNPAYSDFLFTEQGELSYRVMTHPLSLYVFSGPDLKSLCRQFAEIKGFSPLPPYWTMGYHHSRWEPEESADKIQKLVDDFKKHEIPLDVVHLDIGHMDDFRCFTWHPERFKDPSSLISSLKKDNVRVVVISDPGLKSDKKWPIFKKAMEKGLFCRDKKGRPLSGEVWPGRVSLVDFFNHQSAVFWGELYSDYLAKGVEGFWIDMNEPSLFSPRRIPGPECLHETSLGTLSHSELHNLYGHLMAKATYEGLRKLEPAKRPFILSRSAFIGTEKYAATWTGDNKNQWEHLRMSVPMLLNMGLSGQAMVGPDIGGFFGNTEKELFIRWMELGRFYPFCRNHRCEGTRAQEPWSFDQETLEAFKHCLGIRYSLLPHFYTAFYQASVSGIPPMRPLFMEFPEDPMTYEKQIAESEFMLGDSLLVAPVLGPGLKLRALYLPRGHYWFDYYSSQLVKGGAIHSTEAPLGRTPFFVKAGTALFQSAPALNSNSQLTSDLLCNLYPAKRLYGQVYLDEGEGYAYEYQKYSLLAIKAELTENSLELAIEKTEGSMDYRALGKHKSLKIYIPDPYGPSIREVQIKSGSASRRLSSGKQGSYLVIELRAEDIPAYLSCAFS
ncbi:MAG: hypothetical protein JXR70_19595 [Spirochaetales bacterium]|nr:hypothetical protein [Spirochaetales bacterium]